jgi:hypothetical protein
VSVIHPFEANAYMTMEEIEELERTKEEQLEEHQTEDIA